jgi:hypothetical protein
VKRCVISRKWHFTHGESDLVGNSFRYYGSGNNIYVDISDSTFSKENEVAGTLQLKEQFTLKPDY